MWKLLLGSVRFTALDGIGGVSPGPVTPLARAQATNQSVSDLYHQQEAGKPQEDTQTQASQDLMALSQDGKLTSDEVKVVKDIQAKIAAGGALKPEDVVAIRFVIERLEKRIQEQATPAATPVATAAPAQPVRDLKQAQEHHAKGKELYEKGQYAEAEKELRAAWNAVPEDQTKLFYAINHDLAVALAKNGKQEEADKLFVLDAKSHYYAGIGLNEKKQWVEAEKELREAIALAPPGKVDVLYQFHYQLGRSLAAQGKNEEAIKAYGDSIKADPNSSWAADARKEIQKLGGTPPEVQAPAPVQEQPQGPRTATNQDLLQVEAEALKDNNVEVLNAARKALAQRARATTDPKELDELSRSSSFTVKNAAAGNPHVSAEISQRILAEKPAPKLTEAEEKSKLNRGMTNKELLEMEAQALQKMMDGDKSTQNRDVMRIADRELVKRAQESTDPGELEQLSQAKINTVKDALAANPRTSAATLHRILAGSHTDETELIAIKNPNLSYADLQHLASDGINDRVKQAAKEALKARGK